MIKPMWRPPRAEPGAKMPRRDRTLPENFKYYGHWGFAIYRTYYNPDSDKHWDMLLDTLKRQTYLALGSLDDEDLHREDIEERNWDRWSYGDQDEYVEDIKRLKELFHLDTREDPSLLNGLDIRQLRELCLQEHSKAERTMAGHQFRYALVADEAVLKDIARGEFIIKAVAYSWKEGDDYWGWMRVPTGYLLELWHSLMLWRFKSQRVLYFTGPEDHLESYIWAGEDAAIPTSCCSEIRSKKPHYSAQRPQ
ncbi:hypothetical protein FSARC_3412 [Fusarium sarcochroum]|uniref:Uncharacterized protein n=1 Tax=Fusarium sarcochroum TaxID=1208366 RepID=A0A8H4U447_9HYPO|nr:hypothetical protein FSARC_3412 [Fusarium sarcochroum]